MKTVIFVPLVAVGLLSGWVAAEDVAGAPVKEEEAAESAKEASEAAEKAAAEETAAAEKAAEEAAAEAAAKEEAEEAERVAKIEAERTKAVGEELDVLFAKGREYKKVTITGVDNVGVKIRHESGTARLNYEDVPEEMQERFGYDPDRARKQAMKEAQQAAARRQRMREQMSKAKGGGGDQKKPRSKPSPKAPEPVARSGDENLSEEAEGKIQALEAKIAKLEEGVEEAREVVTAFQDKAAEMFKKATYEVEQRDQEGNKYSVTKYKKPELDKAEYYEGKAKAEAKKIVEANKIILRYRGEIKKIKRDGSR